MPDEQGDHAVTQATGPIAALKRAFVSGGAALDGGSSCPSATEIWDAAHAQIDRSRAFGVVAHVGRCASCAADWSLALGGEERPAADVEPVRRSPAMGWLRLAGAAAVIVALGWLGLRNVRESTTEPPFREMRTATEIRALVPEGRPLPRSAPILRWTSAGEGARYTIELSAEDLTPLHTEHGLTATELTIPEDVLARIGPGGTIVWRVEARLADGSRIESSAFVHRVE